MRDIVITAVEVEADGIHEAADKSLEYQADNGHEQFILPKTSVNEAAVEAALVGAWRSSYAKLPETQA